MKRKIFPTKKNSESFQKEYEEFELKNWCIDKMYIEYLLQSFHPH